MKIAFVSDCNVEYLKKFLFLEYQNFKYTNAGAPSVTAIIEGLIKLGHDVTVYRRDFGSENQILKGEHLTIKNICFHLPPLIGKIFASYYIGMALRKNIVNEVSSYDCIHAQWSYDNILAILPWRHQRNILCSPRDWHFYIFKISKPKDKLLWIYKCILAEYIYHCKNIHFVANSPYMQQLLIHKVKKQVPIIPNPTNDTFIIPNRSYYPTHPIIVSILTSYDKRKNCDTLLYAFKKFSITYTNAKLILIGPPYYKENLAMVNLKNMGLLDNVELKGKMSHIEILKIIKNSSMLVHPAIEETFGNTLIEAMGCWLPVIGGKNSGAVPYVLDYGKCGILCDVLSVNELCDAMHQMLNPTIRESYTQAAYNRVKNNFTQTIVAQQHIQLYLELIKGK